MSTTSGKRFAFAFETEVDEAELGTISCSLTTSSDSSIESALLNIVDYGIKFLLVKATDPFQKIPSSAARHVTKTTAGLRMEVVVNDVSGSMLVAEHSPFEEILTGTPLVGMEALNALYDILLEPYMIATMSEDDAGTWLELHRILSLVVMFSALLEQTPVSVKPSNPQPFYNIMSSYLMNVMINGSYGYTESEHKALDTTTLWAECKWIAALRAPAKKPGIVPGFSTLPTRMAWNDKWSKIPATDPVVFNTMIEITSWGTFDAASAVVMSQIIPWFVVASHIGDGVTGFYKGAVNAIGKRLPDASSVLFRTKSKINPKIDAFPENQTATRIAVASLGLFLEPELLGHNEEDVIDAIRSAATDRSHASQLWAYVDDIYRDYANVGSRRRSVSTTGGSPSKVLASKTQSRRTVHLEKISTKTQSPEKIQSLKKESMASATGSRASLASATGSRQSMPLATGSKVSQPSVKFAEIADTGIGANIVLQPRGSLKQPSAPRQGTPPAASPKPSSPKKQPPAPPSVVAAQTKVVAEQPGLFGRFFQYLLGGGVDDGSAYGGNVAPPTQQRPSPPGAKSPAPGTPFPRNQPSPAQQRPVAAAYVIPQPRQMGRAANEIGIESSTMAVEAITSALTNLAVVRHQHVRYGPLKQSSELCRTWK